MILFSAYKLKIILDSIEELPLINIPGVLGLHSNAEMGYFTKASRDIWNNLLKLQPQTGKLNCYREKKLRNKEKNSYNIILLESYGSGVSREEFIDAVAEDILLKVPQQFVISDIKKRYDKNFIPSTIVLLQELEIFNLLIDKIIVTLSMLRKVNLIIIIINKNKK